MAQTLYYRYVSLAEAQAVRTRRLIQSRRGITYYTPDFYDDPNEAYVKLGLPDIPDCRVGPIPADEMPDFDVVPLRPVDFVDVNRLGGGVQVATSKEVRLFDIYEFSSRSSLLATGTS